MKNLDYSGAGRDSKLEIIPSKEDNLMFCRATGDTNDYHNPKRYTNTGLGRRVGSEILTGMMLSMIGEVFSYYVMNRDGNGLIELASAKIKLASPALPGHGLVYTVEGRKGQDISLEVRTSEIQSKRKDKGDRRLKDALFVYREELGEFSEDIGGYQQVLSKQINAEEIRKVLESIGLSPEGYTPAMLWAAYTISEALLRFKNISDSMKGKSFFYNSLGFEFYKGMETMDSLKNTMLRCNRNPGVSLDVLVKLAEEQAGKMDVSTIVACEGKVLCKVDTKLATFEEIKVGFYAKLMRILQLLKKKAGNWYSNS